MLTRMTHDAAANDVLHQLGGYTGQADRVVICSVVALSFFKDWYNIGFPPVLWDLPLTGISGRSSKVGQLPPRVVPSRLLG